MLPKASSASDYIKTEQKLGNRCIYQKDGKRYIKKKKEYILLKDFQEQNKKSKDAKKTFQKTDKKLGKRCIYVKNKTEYVRINKEYIPLKKHIKQLKKEGGFLSCFLCGNNKVADDPQVDPVQDGSRFLDESKNEELDGETLLKEYEKNEKEKEIIQELIQTLTEKICEHHNNDTMLCLSFIELIKQLHNIFNKYIEHQGFMLEQVFGSLEKCKNKNTKIYFLIMIFDEIYLKYLEHKSLKESPFNDLIIEIVTVIEHMNQQFRIKYKKNSDFFNKLLDGLSTLIQKQTQNHLKTTKNNMS